MRIKLGRPLLLKQIAQEAECTLLFSEEDPCLTAVDYLSTDTREILPGDLFVALKTEKDDGNRYLAQAIKRGASGLLINREAYSEELSGCLLIAENTWDALRRFAVKQSEKIPHKTIAITGSVGKTTTRHLVATVLGEAFHVHESHENFNNLLGTCLTLLSMPYDTEYLVAEIGMDAPGQISVMSHCLCPDIAVITGIGISHLEKLKTVEAICRAKLEILDGMKHKELFCPSTEPLLCHLAPIPPHTYSALDTGAEYHGENIRNTASGIMFDLSSPFGKLTNITVPILSVSLLSGAVFAATAGMRTEMSEEAIRRALARFRPLPLRQNVIPLGGILLLLDCYNASPDSMKAAGEAAEKLQEMTGGKIVALLGDMLELGEASQSSHREIGTYLAGICKAIFCVGDFSAEYKKGAEFTGQCDVYSYPPETQKEKIVAEILPVLCRNDILLIKGSRADRMESYLPLLREQLL